MIYLEPLRGFGPCRITGRIAGRIAVRIAVRRSVMVQIPSARGVLLGARNHARGEKEKAETKKQKAETKEKKAETKAEKRKRKNESGNGNRSGYSAINPAVVGRNVLIEKSIVKIIGVENEIYDTDTAGGLPTAKSHLKCQPDRFMP